MAREIMYMLHVLFTGYSRRVTGGTLANCTCTLIKGSVNIIVDTMTSWDREILVDAMRQHGIDWKDIDFVVSTHGHSDHTGNNNLFLSAKHVVGNSVSYEHMYYDYETIFNRDGVFKIDEYVQIVTTPGHTLSDVSVIVRTDEGLVGVVGDLYECEEDINDESIWLNAGSENPDLQRQHRKAIMEQVDWIVPGHGPMFATAKYK